MHNKTYIETVIEKFKKQKIAYFSWIVVLIFCLVGTYAPFLASSKPILVNYDGTWYFPLFRYLFFQGFYTKPIDLFFNLLMFTLPFMLISYYLFKKQKKVMWFCLSIFVLLQFGLFLYFYFVKPKDPAEDISLNLAKQKELNHTNSFDNDLKYMNDYKKLNLILKYRQLKRQNERLEPITTSYEQKALNNLIEQKAKDKKAYLLRNHVLVKDLPSDVALKEMVLKELSPEEIKAYTQIPTLWNINEENKRQDKLRLQDILKEHPDNETAKESLKYIEDKDLWLLKENKKISFELMPLIREFHFEEDVGGEQSLNQYLPWWELSRVNRKDLVASLIFGIRVSLVVGLLAVGLSLLIAIPIGAYAGYYGGTFDIIVSRLLEVLEAMPIFFMLLMIIALMQSKSIFLVILMIGLFGWTGFSRYIRAEFFKQRNLPYVESCHALGFKNSHIMFSHILPNAIPPLLTLLPFAIMGAITAEAGLSFLGLGEEGSASWGVLMDEGRTAFPQESYLLWPPAIMLTTLLVAIALIGDGIRDAIDPKSN